MNLVQIEMIELFDRKNVDLTIGIISTILKEDQTLIDVIKKSIANPSTTLELANHTPLHEVMPNFSKEDQFLLVQTANTEIFEMFGVVPTTFIPPQNVFNVGTLEAIAENNLTHFSASPDYDAPPYPLSDSTLYRFPLNTETAELDDVTDLWNYQSPEFVFNEIKKGVEKNGFSVVMMHPYEYAQTESGALQNVILTDRISELGLLLDMVQDSGIRMVAIGEINIGAQPIEQPEQQTAGESSVIFEGVEETLDRPSLTCNCVAFRLDGIQDYWLNLVQIEVVKTMLENDIPVTIGISGNSFGEDPKLLKFFLGATTNGGFEISLNGVGSEDFSEVPKDSDVFG